MSTGATAVFSTPAVWTDGFLESMTRQADDLADQTVTALNNEHGIDAVNALWNHLLTNDDPVPPQAPPPILNYFEQSAVLPPWADLKLMTLGEKFFADRGLFCLVSLLCAGLPECYVLKTEAAVLGTTQQLELHAYRRVFETTQLIVAVMREEGLRGQGHGIKVAQKVRLMHAAIRHLILHTSGRREVSGPPKSFADAVSGMPAWDVAKSGQPINQEQLAYTLLTFSYVILRAFDGLKITVTPDERNAYLHCWNVVGHLMGVRQELLAFSPADAADLFSKIKQRQVGPSADGRALALALVRCSEQIISHETDGLLARWFVNRLPAVFMRMLLDEVTAKDLDLPTPGPFQWVLLWLFQSNIAPLERFYQKVILRFGQRFGDAIIMHVTKIPRGWNRKLFVLPKQLRTAWKIKMTSQ